MLIGTMLGPYEIQAKLDEGGMGEVYRARDTRLDRTVAIKILPAELSAGGHRSCFLSSTGRQRRGRRIPARGERPAADGRRQRVPLLRCHRGQERRVASRTAASTDGSRDVTVVPIGSEQALRNCSWIEDNRRYVDRMSNGRIACVYMPDTAFGGYTFFNRYFCAQAGKDGVMVDERFNGGGTLATDIAEQLGRRLMSVVATRDGENEVQPQGAIFGPKAMLVNEMAGSGGGAMPWYFRKAGLGPLIGKRTWGGLVGRAYGLPLMDGGYVGSPSSAVWYPATSRWIAENLGVAPDIEVEQDPAHVRQGKDPQLDKAIEVVMAALGKTPRVDPKRPAYPAYKR